VVNFDDNVDIKRDWGSVREVIKISAPSKVVYTLLRIKAHVLTKSSQNF
jgi:hypothetical protein